MQNLLESLSSLECNGSEVFSLPLSNTTWVILYIFIFVHIIGMFFFMIQDFSC